MQFKAIKGLTLSYPEVGRIKIGKLGDVRKTSSGAEFRMPEKLDHFRVTRRVRDAKDGQFLRDEIVHQVVGDKPTELQVALLYDDPYLNCPNCLTCYDGTKRFCYGNNEEARRLDAKGIYQERPCPCNLYLAPEQAEENTGRQANKLLKCSPYGVLRVQLLCRKDSIGCYGFRTRSGESISNFLTLMSSILFRTGGILAGIPLRLAIYPTTDNTPRGATTNYKVMLDLPEGGWDAVEKQARAIVTHRAATRYDLKALEAAHRRELEAVLEHPEEVAGAMAELFPSPIVESVNGVEVLTEAEEAIPTTGNNGTAHATPEPPAVEPPDPAPSEGTQPEATATAGKGPGDPPPGDPEPDAPDSDEVAYAEADGDDAQRKVLTRLALRKGFKLDRLTKKLEQFTGKERRDLLKHLLSLSDAGKKAAPEQSGLWR